MALVCGMCGALTTIYFLVYNWLRGPSPYPKRAGKPLSTGDDGSEDRAGVTAEDLSFWGLKRS